MFAKRAMLVELTIRQWTARKHDKSASNTVKTLTRSLVTVANTTSC